MPDMPGNCCAYSSAPTIRVVLIVAIYRDYTGVGMYDMMHESGRYLRISLRRLRPSDRRESWAGGLAAGMFSQTERLPCDL